MCKQRIIAWHNDYTKQMKKTIAHRFHKLHLVSCFQRNDPCERKSDTIAYISPTGCSLVSTPFLTSYINLSCS